MAIAYAYTVAKNNEDIDGFILNRQQDAPEEIADGLALGLIDVNGNKKISYEWFSKMDSDEIQAQVAPLLKQ